MAGRPGAGPMNLTERAVPWSGGVEPRLRALLEAGGPGLSDTDEPKLVTWTPERGRPIEDRRTRRSGEIVWMLQADPVRGR
jgi:hypothetical protein